MLTILIVGQTPPPLGGQAIMIQQLLAGKYRDVHLVHVRMNFSKGLDSAGKFKIKKIVELLSVFLKIVIARVLGGADVLYYPPAGPNIVPVIRDILLLAPTRWMFRKTIFHFHAGGLNEMYCKFPSAFRFVFKAAYFQPDISIRVSDKAPNDGYFLKAKREFIVPNGIEDHAEKLLATAARADSTLAHILFVGVLREDKGVLILLRACSRLRQSAVQFHLTCVGNFASEEFRHVVHDYVVENGLSECVRFPGVLSGDLKSSEYLNADIFCFPTFFDSETFGIVLLEAMSFALPVVTTEWRGIPSVVKEGETAFLVPIKNEEGLAERLVELIGSPHLRRQMGAKGRERFLLHFTLENYYRNFQQVFDCCR